MSRRERQRSFAIAVLVVVATIAAVSALGGSDDPTRPRAATSPPAVTSAPRALPVPTDVSPAEDPATVVPDAAGRRARSAAERLARHFIAVFARYQAGRVDKTTVVRLRALATSELAAYLLAQPPRRSTRTRGHPRIARLDLTGPLRGRVKAAALLTYGDRRTSLFEVAIEHSGSGWRVAELYPSAGA
jgi:hypothetical protein